ncbi:MAG: hypothetical protein IH951_10390 [Bacteroidetes bacterium]|nr:hypothetical protein [Bacteroidota bacterium]
MLSLDDRGRAHTLMLERLVSYNHVARLHEEGLLDDDEFEAIQGTYFSIMRTPGAGAWWAAYKHCVPKKLESHVTSRLDAVSIARRPIMEE